MPREVEGLENLNRILELPLGSKFGMFVDGSMNAFKVAGYLDRPVGSVVTEHDEQRFTETFFVSMNELNNAKL